MNSTKIAGVAFLAGLVLGGTTGIVRNGHARDRAIAATARADALQTQTDSMHAAYQRDVDSAVALVADSLEREARESSERAAKAERDKRAALARFDSLVATVGPADSLWVPRPIYDATVVAAREAQAAAAAKDSAQSARIFAVEGERDTYRGLWVRADSGWTAERAVSENYRVAAEKWKRAASPSFGAKLLTGVK